MRKGEIPLIIFHKHTGRVMLKHFLNMNNKIFENFDFYQDELYEITIYDNLKLKNVKYIKLI